MDQDHPRSRPQHQMEIGEDPPVELPPLARRRHLQVVDQQSGEVLDQCPSCAYLEEQLAGAENNVRSMRSQMAKMKAELDGEIDRSHRLFPTVMALFRYWQERCKHQRVSFTPEHMKVGLARLKEHEPETCRRAIRGAAFDPYISTMKNGRKHRHDDWFQIMHPQKFQSFVDRAPDPGPMNFTQRSLVEAAKEISVRVLERAKLIESQEDPAALGHLLLEVNSLCVEWSTTPYRPYDQSSEPEARVSQEPLPERSHDERARDNGGGAEHGTGRSGGGFDTPVDPVSD